MNRKPLVRLVELALQIIGAEYRRRREEAFAKALAHSEKKG